MRPRDADGKGKSPVYEFFEHTADLGLRVRAGSLDELFAGAATALFAAIVEDATSLREADMHEIRIDGNDREYLLFDWLRELLYRFDADGRLYRRFDVAVDDGGLTARAWGEPLDRSRHELGHEVKAITYHGLRVESADEGWLAEVIVDI